MSLEPMSRDQAASKLRILMLATDAHGGFGGISQYNRDVIEALSRNDRIASVTVVPRVVHDRDFALPDRVTYDLGGTVGLGAYLRRAASYVIGGGRFDLVYCAHVNLAPLARAIATARRVPMVLAIYGIEAWQPPARRAARWACGAADLVVSISRITLDRFLAWSRPAPRFHAILPNAIHTDGYAAGARNPELERRLRVQGRKVVLTFGRMSADERYKGFDEVLAVLPRLREREPRIAYIAAGDGDDRPRLEAKARELGVADIVTFPGRIAEADKADLYRLADAYVMPSSGEGFGFVVLEALACGIPVVASTLDGTREAIRDGELGQLVDPKDGASLETAILAALATPKAIPEGLAYFSFPGFERRLDGALATLRSAG